MNGSKGSGHRLYSCDPFWLILGKFSFFFFFFPKFSALVGICTTQMTLRQSSCWMLQDGTYICPVGKFVVEEMGTPEEVEGGRQEGNNTATGPPSAPVQEGTEGALPKQVSQLHVSAPSVRNRLHDGSMYLRYPEIGPVLTGQHHALHPPLVLALFSPHLTILITKSKCIL